MKSYTYRVIIEPDGNGFHGYVPALPGCHTSGSSIEETQKHLNDAISLYLGHLQDTGRTIPEEQSLESFATVSVPPIVHA